jgi:hypothetical protein
VELKSIIRIETCFCTHVRAYLIFWICGLTQNLNGFKIPFERLLKNKIGKKERELTCTLGIVWPSATPQPSSSPHRPVSLAQQ